MQDQANYVSNEKNVFSCKALSIIKRQKEKETKKWEDTNKNNERLYSAYPNSPAVSVNVSTSAFYSNDCATSGKCIQLDPKQL